MLLAVLFLLVLLEDEDVVDVRHNSFAVPGQGRHLHSPQVVVAVVVAAVAVVVAAVVIVGLHWHSSGVQVYFEESLD
jgi:hypothetical protein